MNKPISPSSLDKFANGCERAWAYNKLDGIVEPETDAQREGKEMHHHLEWWLKEQRPISERTRAGRMAAALVPHLPMPRSPGLLVEVHVSFQFGGLTYHGYPDARWQARGFRVVHDHKGMSELKWAKSGDDLLHDPQRIIYGYNESTDVFSQWGNVERKTSGPGNKEHAVYPTELFQTRPQIVEAMEWLHETHGVRLAQAYNEPADARPKNFSYCAAYNKPCTHLAYCHEGTTAKQRLKGIFTMSSLQERLAAKRAALGLTNQPAPGPIDPVAPTPEEETPKTETATEALERLGNEALAEEEAREQADGNIATSQIPEVAEASAAGRQRRERSDKGKPRAPYNTRKGDPPTNEADAPEPKADAKPASEKRKATSVPSLQALEEIAMAVENLRDAERDRVLKAACVMFGVT